jgi:hypothetical protein
MSIFVTSVADLDPGSGAILIFFTHPGSGMNTPDHISESLEIMFWVKILKFFDADPGSWIENIRIRDKHLGSSTLLVTSVVDWHRFDAVPDPDPTFHFKADPDPDRQALCADPNPVPAK